MEFPLKPKKIETEDGTQYFCAEVYSLETLYTSDIEKRIKDNYDAWLEKAKIPQKQDMSLADVMEAVNVLTDIVLGGE